MKTTARAARARATTRTLFEPTTLAAAIDRLGFVQADPIRSPARAQDLILRHRVAGYRAQELERSYAALDVEEDLLYAYGFVARPVWRLLHPRRGGRLSSLEQRILAWVRERGATHPRALEAQFGRGRVTNAWGGTSKETTAALERLHHRGLLRVARRERGIRLYEAAPGLEPAPPDRRLEQLALAVARVMDPIAEPTLHTLVAALRRWLPGAHDHRAIIRELLRRGELERHVVDGLAYLTLAEAGADVVDHGTEPPRRVSLLAPFDPVVWDRRRFEHLWGWPYRFEAYTPVAKRVRGYYAMPLLWGDRVIGWANATVARGALGVELGFVGKRPVGRDFRRELDAEIARLEAFLAPWPRSDDDDDDDDIT